MAETSALPQPKWYRHLWLALRVVFIVVVLVLIFSRIDLALFLQQVQALHFGYAALGFIAVLTGTAFASLRWHVLLKVVVGPVRFLPLFIFNLIGIFYSQFLPGSITSDVVKGYYLARTESDKVRIFSSVIMDRLIGMSMNGMIGMVALLTNPEILEAVQIAPWLPSVLIVLLAVGIIAVVVFFPLLGRWKGRFPSLLASFYDVFSLYRQHPFALFKAVLANTGFFFIWALGIWGLALAVGLTELTFPVMILILAVVNFVQTIPITINGWGVREGALILLLSVYAVPNEEALLLSLLMVVVNLIIAAIGGLFVLSNYRYIRQQN